MRNIKFILLFIIVSVNSFSQNILTINNEGVSLDEFKNIFYKNNHDEKIDQNYLDEYIQLFVNYKLKVKEAEALNMDTVSTFISELAGYKKQLAKPYMRNKEFDDNMIREAYDRMLKDVRASHILINIEEDDKESYNKALSIRKDILEKKISFSDAAKKYSEDKSASYNGGDLGYFTAFMMVYDFESAAYNMKIGDISMPIRTKYGYHIIKVTDKRDAVGEVQVAHIMFKINQEDKNSINVAGQKINQVYERLKSGEEFSDVAERFSEDRSTAVNGGRLPPFGVGKMVPDFEEVAFGLLNVNDISIPFKTDFGWHIVKLIDKKPVSSLSVLKDDITNKISRDSRSDLSKSSLIAKLKKEYKIVNKVSVFSSLRRHAFVKVSNGTWSSDYENISDVLFTIDTMLVRTQEFIDYILINQKSGSDFDVMYQEYVNQRLLDYEKNMLEYKYPEYKSLLKEYREGILLFDLTNKKVWKKAVEDTVGLQNYFNMNIQNYMWGDRVNATIYNCASGNISRSVKEYLFKKKLGIRVSEKDLLDKMNMENPLNLNIVSNKFSVNDNEYIDMVEWKKGLAKDIKLDNGSVILIDIYDVLDKEPKKINETRGKVISDYQNYLEQNWILELRKKYNISIDYSILYSLINNE